MMNHVAEVTEALPRHERRTERPRRPEARRRRARRGAGAGRWQIVQDLRRKLVVIWSQTGATARVFSKHRFPVPIIALSTDPRALRQMAMHYGVIPPRCHPRRRHGRPDRRRRRAGAGARSWPTPGDRIVLVAGWSPAMPSTMNGIIIHTLGEKWAVVRPGNAPAGRAQRQGGEMSVGSGARPC